jgi:long-chain fatty acid transport protein
MSFQLRIQLCKLFILAVASCIAPAARAQAIGVELHNTLMPASGGMGGASLARPQDLVSAINGNPATMTQLHGTQFSFGGGWVEPTYNVSYDGSVPLLNGLGLAMFDAKSGAPGAALGNIGLTQELSAFGLPVTMGLGMIAASGAGVDFRAVPGSNGTTALVTILDIVAGAGVDVTDRLSAGASIRLSSATMDGPFVGITAAVPAYSLRGNAGLDYDLTPDTNLGLYYQSPAHYRFDDAVSFGGAFQDIELGLPHNLGFGVANSSLCDGCLLLAADVLYKQWTATELLGALYEDQWALQLGAQYTRGRIQLRAGYVFAENPIRDDPGASAGGVSPPGGIAAIEYVQAQFAAINKHRVSVGLGVRDVLPGVDMDLFAGGMFRESQDFGTHTSANVEAYFIGFGTTWRFGRGDME